jgi:hypothetical protein
MVHCDNEGDLLLADWTGWLGPGSIVFLFIVNNQLVK